MGKILVATNNFEGMSNELWIFSVEHLSAYKHGSLPPTHLKLKLGCIVMCLTNLNPNIGLMNGTKLRVTQLLSNQIIGQIISNTKFRGF